jgi:predicted nucleic acid-binding protein
VWLLDTNVVSEFRKQKPDGRVVRWVQSISPEALFISVVTLGEVQRGVEKLREPDAARAADLELWLDHLVRTSNVVGLDAAALRMWGRLIYRQDDSVFEDALIAATALTRDLGVATRNVKDFSRWKVRVINPFDGLPP